jgi:hypothetical protein
MMKRVMLISAFTLALATLLFIANETATPIAAQEVIAGDWTAKVKQTDRGPKLWLTLNVNREERRGRYNMSSDFPLQDFSGLNPNAGGNTQFTLARDAGTVTFEGIFQNGLGVGGFRFTPCAGWATRTFLRKSFSAWRSTMSGCNTSMS